MDTTLALGVAILLVGFIVGYRIHILITLARKNTVELDIKEKLMKAREDAQRILAEADEKIALAKKDVKTSEEHLIKREESLDTRQKQVDTFLADIEKRGQILAEKESYIGELLLQKTLLLEQIAGLSHEDALRVLIAETEKDHQEDLAVKQMKIEEYGAEHFKSRAQDIIATVIQRLASPAVSSLTTTSLMVPNDESKGRIIGKEGRNIRAFERSAGVELIIDDAPGYITVSCFDPIRRAIATKALEVLLEDGRIHPTKIEEELAKAKESVYEIVKEKGTKAVYECGIVNFDPKLVTLLGQLFFRSSYGQNVLEHSIETAHIAGMLAEEIGADVAIAKAGALVHDIGKAIDHEFEGTHVVLGMKVLKRFGVDERIITAMKSHHEEFPYESIEAIIVQTADMISSSRPGARRDTTELYIKRLQELERIANSFEGIEKAYALQAGREVRIFVHPDRISEYDAKKLARSVTLTIEKELRYPGEIRVIVIRETRSVDFAR